MMVSWVHLKLALLLVNLLPHAMAHPMVLHQSVDFRIKKKKQNCFEL